MSDIDERYVQKILSLEDKLRLEKDEVYQLKKKHQQIESKKPYLVVNTSKNEARRLREQGAIGAADLNTPNIMLPIGEDQVIIPPKGRVFKIGKKIFVKFIP